MSETAYPSNFNPGAFGQSDFLQAAQQLLPTGPLWNRDGDSLLTAVVGGISDGTAAVHALCAELLTTESDPRYCEQLLPDFERIWGLPDTCTPLAPTIGQQRSALLAKIASQGGQSRAYFIMVAATYSYVVTITEYQLFRAGISVAGNPVYYEYMIFEWEVNVPISTPDPQFECIINRLKPAHTLVNFSYDGVPEAEFTDDGGVLVVPSAAGYPTSPTGLAAGAVWSNGGAVAVVPGVTPNPAAALVYFGIVTPAELLALGGGNLPLSNPGIGSQALWNDGGEVVIA